MGSNIMGVVEKEWNSSVDRSKVTGDVKMETASKIGSLYICSIFHMKDHVAINK